MISNELQKKVELFNKQGRMCFVEAASEEQITQFERNNKVSLPRRFKEWLLFSDGGELFLPAGIQLYGVAHQPLIDVTDSDRPNDRYIVIGALASGDPILCEIDSDKIFIYNRQEGRIEDDEVYGDFFSFLDDLFDLLGIGE